MREGGIFGFGFGFDFRFGEMKSEKGGKGWYAYKDITSIF